MLHLNAGRHLVLGLCLPRSSTWTDGPCSSCAHATVLIHRVSNRQNVEV